jgi:hypothetical protein
VIKQFTNCSWQPFVGRPGQLREIEASWPGPALESIANPPGRHGQLEMEGT